MSASDQKNEADLGHIVAQEVPLPDSPHSPRLPHSPASHRVRSHDMPSAVSLTADPQVQAALAELRRQQDEEKAEHRAAMSHVLAINQQLVDRMRLLESRSSVSSTISAPTQSLPGGTSVPPALSYSFGINPALLATPATVRLPLASQPALSSPEAARVPNAAVARGLFLDPPAVSHTQLPLRPYNDEEKGWDKWVQDVKKTIKIDAFKGSNDDERRSVRTWVTSLSMQLDLIAPPRRSVDGLVDRDRQQYEQARVAATYLQGGALDWALMYQIQCRAASEPVRWDKMSFALLAKYEGQDHGLLRRQELVTLTYKRGRCTDLPKYEAEFDRLALLVYGPNMQIFAVDELLGQTFASGIQRGDQQLYESMIPVGSNMPQTLQEWKARAESAIVRAQALKLGSNSTRASAGQAALHNTEVKEEHTVKPAAAAAESSSQSSAQPVVDMTQLAQLLAIMQAQKPKGKPQSQSGRSRKYQLTPDEKSKLFSARRCFCCYKVGHNARDCSQKATLPNRAPNADELKA